MPPPPASALAEQDLADRARDGDEAALGELYQRHARQLHRHAWRMLRDEASAGDVVQEAFLRAISAMPRTREGLRFRAWMFRIVTNLCLRELTLRGRLESDRDPDAAASTELGPEEQRARSEWAQLVTAALEQLPARYRQILLLREVEGLDYDELGQALELSSAMVKVTLHRARGRFRAHLVAGQLLCNPGLVETCPELPALAAPGQGHRLERHLESCPRCREEQPSLGTLLAALPPPPPLPDLSSLLGAGSSAAGSGTTLPGSSAAASSTVATSSSGVGAFALGLAAALGVAGVVAITVAGSRAMRQAAPPPPAARAQPKAALAGAASEQAGAAREAVSDPLLSMRRQPGSAARKNRRDSDRPRSRPVPLARAATPAPARRAPADEQPLELQAALLRLRVEFVPGGLLIERGSKTFVATPRQKLHLNDLLVTRGARSVVLRFPEDQWLVLLGRLRLIDPADPTGSGPVRVELLAGQARAKATRRGRGLTVLAAQRQCSSEQGEFRVRAVKSGLRVESLTALVRIQGPHAERTVPRASQVLLAARPGFTAPLLLGPERVRPVLHRGPAAPQLSWEPVRGATGYRVLIAAEPNFWIPEETAVVREPSYWPYTDRPGRHFFQVIPLQGEAEGYPSKVYAYLVEER